jgi:hypothetical protein
VRDFFLFGGGFVAGMLWLFGLAYFLGRKKIGKVELELTQKWSERSGLTRGSAETFEAFMKRAPEAAARRELEKEWGVPRSAGEPWEAYMQRVAVIHLETKQRAHGMPVVIGPRGQA